MTQDRKQLIRSFLRRHRSNQKELAHELNVDASTLSKWINGVNPWPTDALQQACQWLELTPDEEQQLGGALGTTTIPDDTPIKRSIPQPLPADSPPDSPNFVGRQKELQLYQKQLQTAGIVIITGPIGAGKSALASRLVALAHAHKPLFWYRCFPHEGVFDIIWKLAAHLAHNGHDEAWGWLHAATENGEAPKLGIFYDYLLQHLQGQNYLLYFDDFHNLQDDPLYVGFAERLVASVEKGDFQMVLTSRRRLALGPFQSTPLPPFTLEDTQILFRALGLTIAPAALAQLHTQAAGNLELIKLAAHIWQTDPSSPALFTNLVQADAIQAYLMSHIDQRLPEKERRILSAGAVLLEQPVTPDILEEILDEGDLHRSLLSLRDAYLLEGVDSENRRAYRLPTVVQAFYYDLLGTRQRQDMHGRAATFYAAKDEPFLAATQYLHAGRGMLAAQQATADVRAQLIKGRAAALDDLLTKIGGAELPTLWQTRVALAKGQICSYLHRAPLAQEYFAQAIARLAPLAESGEAVQIRARLCREMGFLLKSIAPAEAVEWLQRGLKDAQHDRELAADLWIQLGNAHNRLGHAEAEAHAYEQACALLPDTNSWLYLLALIGLGKYYFLRGAYVESRQYMQQAKNLADQRQDLINMLAMRVNLGALTFTTSLLWDEASAYYREALALAQRLGNIREAARSRLNLGVLRGWQEHTEGVQLLSTALDNAQAHAIHDIEATCHGYLAAFALHGAAQASAYAHLTAAQALIAHSKFDYLQPFINQLWARYHMHLGHHTQALDFANNAIHVAQQKQMAQEEGTALCMRGQLYARLDQPAEAQADFAASLILLAANPFETARVNLAWALSLPMTAASAAGQSRLQAACAAFRAVRADALLQQANPLLNSDSRSR
ncbi:MAG: AAA family ATPase [Caldilineaceae bacterium]